MPDRAPLCRRCRRPLRPCEAQRGYRYCLRPTCRGEKLCRNCYTRYRGPDCPACAVFGPLKLSKAREGNRPPHALLAERIGLYSAAARSQKPLFPEVLHA